MTMVYFSIEDYLKSVQRKAKEIWVVVVYESCGGIDQFLAPETILDECAGYANTIGVTSIRVNERGGWSWYYEDRP